MKTLPGNFLKEVAVSQIFCETYVYLAHLQCTPDHKFSIMQNDAGDKVDLYIPRKCSATNRLIHAKDHASVQINIAHVDANGVATSDVTPIALCGFIRAGARSDQAFNRLMTEKGFLSAQ